VRIDRHKVTRWVNYAMKVGLVVAFAVAIGLTPDTVEGKAMGFRAPLFLAPIVIVPILARTRAWDPYPHTADALLAVAIVWWEILEWAVSEDGFGGTGGLALTYEDTIGDLFLSSTGGLVGSLLAVWLLGPQRTRPAD